MELPKHSFIDDIPGFAMAVQWHPEWNAANDIVSKDYFRHLESLLG